MESIYTDGVSNVSLVDGVIRLDLIKIVQVEKDKVNLQPVGMLAISLPAFLRLHEQLGNTIDKLVEQGVIKKNESPVNFDAIKQ